MALSTDIYAEVTTTFPASVVGSGGITIAKSGGVYTITFVGADVALNTIALDKLAQLPTDRLLGRDADGDGDVEQITATGGLEFSGEGGIRTSAFTGDVTKAAGATALTIAGGAVTSDKIADDSVTAAKILESEAITLPRNTSVAGVSSITLSSAYLQSTCTVDTYNGGVNSQQEIVLTLPSAAASPNAIIAFVKSPNGPTGHDHAGIMTITDGGSFSNQSSLPGDAQVYKSNGSSWQLIWPSLQSVRGNPVRSHRTITSTPYTPGVKDIAWNLRVITSSNGGFNGDGVVDLPAPTSLAIGYLGWGTWVTNVADGEGHKVTIDAGSGQSINRAGQTYVLEKDFQTAFVYTDGSEWFVFSDTHPDIPWTVTAVSSTDSSWAVPAGTREMWIRGWGSGGSGAGGDNVGNQRGSGGGAGGRFEKYYSGTIDSTLNITIGTPGAAVAAASGGTNGNAGTATTVVGTNLGTLTGNGGGAGQAGVAAGGAGGTATGGDLNVAGGDGRTSSATGATDFVFEGGDASSGGRGGKTNVGSPGKSPGGGGACGNHPSGNSGAGGPGLVIIWTR